MRVVSIFRSVFRLFRRSQPNPSATSLVRTRAMYCGTPAIWRRMRSDDLEIVFAPPPGKPSSRPTYHARNRTSSD